MDLLRIVTWHNKSKVKSIVDVTIYPKIIAPRICMHFTGAVLLVSSYITIYRAFINVTYHTYFHNHKDSMIRIPPPVTWICKCIEAADGIAPIARSYMMTSSNENIFRVTGPLCGELTGPCKFPSHRPVTQNFDIYFDLRLNKLLSQQSWGGWIETPSCPLWRHRYDTECRRRAYSDLWGGPGRTEYLTRFFFCHCSFRPL